MANAKRPKSGGAKNSARDADDPASTSDTGADPDASAPDPPPRVTRHIQPLGPRVLVRVIRAEDRSEAGLYLPQGVKDAGAAALLGEVVEVARTMPKPDALLSDDDDDDDDDDPSAFGTNVSGIPLAANVLFEKDRGIVVPWDENLRLLEVRHVLAIVDIISQDELQ
jgi:co-chaperonin GroES (HSP10)